MKTSATHADLYGLDRWGQGYFDVLESGDFALKNPLSPNAPPVSLPGIIRDLEKRGIQTPMILRVGSYLERAIQQINQGFRDAIERAGYRGVYRGVFPIKVNQQAQVVDRIVEYGRPFDFGLEADPSPNWWSHWPTSCPTTR